MVQTCAVFVDDPTTAKIKTTESFNSPFGAVLCSTLSQEYELWKFVLEPLLAFLQKKKKFDPMKISHNAVSASSRMCIAQLKTMASVFVYFLCV